MVLQQHEKCPHGGSLLTWLKTLRTARAFFAFATAALKRSKSVIAALLACLASFLPHEVAANLFNRSA
jgi:hypothetical protein